MQNVTEAQWQKMDTVLAYVADLEVRWSEDRGVASLLAGQLLPWERIHSPDSILPAVLEAYGTLLGPSNVAQNYRVTDLVPDRRSVHRARAFQVYKGVAVHGATILAFADEERGVFRVQSSFWREVEVTAQLRLEERDLAWWLLGKMRQDPGAIEFESRWRAAEPRSAWAEEHFPLLARPRLYLYPVDEGFHPAFEVWAYQGTQWTGYDGYTRRGIGRARLMLDAATGDVLWQESAREGIASADVAGDGLSALRDEAGNPIVRGLHILRTGNSEYLLVNRTQVPEIRTYDGKGREEGLDQGLRGDEDISRDSDGHWNETTSSCNPAMRASSQQPQADAHFRAEQAWNFYHPLGWDGFDNGIWGEHCPVRIVTHVGHDNNAYFAKVVEWDPELAENQFDGYLAFGDGMCSAGKLRCDFTAADPIIFGHEYQHAVSYYGARTSQGDPGHLYGNPWLAAIREALSDGLACLQHGLWLSPPFAPDGVLQPGPPFTRRYGDAETTCYGMPFRRLEFPRSTDTYSGQWFCDHYDDRDAAKDSYFHSTLLSHVAFLVGQGGVHQRANRDAILIPVEGIGRERAAEIFLYALTRYFDTLPTNLGMETLIEAARLLLDAAEAVSGNKRTKEYAMMRRALYAVGLYPYDSNYRRVKYGGEACMLPWTHDWRYSRPYLGFPDLRWRSPDLFVNNGGTSHEDAVVGQENRLFARVRNIGDEDLTGIRVRHYFAPLGTNVPPGLSHWRPCLDASGDPCVLEIASLAAGGVNITDTENPPSHQAVSWFLDPAHLTSGVDSFCLRAVVECWAPIHDHVWDASVQTAVRHVSVRPGAPLDLSLQVHNQEWTPLRVDVRVDSALPSEYAIRHEGPVPLRRTFVARGEPRTTGWRFTVPRRRPERLEPPYDGRLAGAAKGGITGFLDAQLSEVRTSAEPRVFLFRPPTVELAGVLAGTIEQDDEHVTIIGRFVGEVDLASAAVEGRFRGTATCRDGRTWPGIELGVEGCLQPLRAVHLTQLVGGEPAGGTTIHVKTPRLRGQCDPEDWRTRP